jgi:hypothetical protein
MGYRKSRQVLLSTSLAGLKTIYSRTLQIINIVPDKIYLGLFVSILRFPLWNAPTLFTDTAPTLFTDKVL